MHVLGVDALCASQQFFSVMPAHFPILKHRVKCLAQGNNTVPPVSPLIPSLTLLVYHMHVWRLFIAALWSPVEKGLTSMLLFVMFNCTFVTFPCGILGQVWYLIVSIPDLCSTFLLFMMQVMSVPKSHELACLKTI